MESLGEYVQRIMKEKNLKVADVARRSQEGLGETYITNVAKGEATNLTVVSIQSLALGLGVDPVELFKVAIGYELTEVSLPALIRVLEKLSDLETSELILLLDQMDRKQIKTLTSSAKKTMGKSRKRR